MKTHPDFPNLRPVPILRGAICVGLDRRTNSLIFYSQEYGEVQIFISSESNSRLLFQYKVWDDTTEMVYVRRGYHGDPLRDEIIKGPLTWDEEEKEVR